MTSAGVHLTDEEYAKLMAVVSAVKQLVGGWDYDHEGWQCEIKDLKALQAALGEIK